MQKKIAAFSHRTFSALKKRNFRLYFIGQSFSLAGTWMQAVAQSWLMLHLTGSGTALGIVGALQYGPTLFLGPYAGILADRLPKRRILFVTQGLMGVIALALGVAVARGTATAGLVYALAGVLGLVTAVDYPTRQSFLYELAGRRELLSAVGLSGMAANVMRVVGPAVAGVLIAAADMATCFYVNAATSIVVLVTLVQMRPKELVRTGHDEATGGLKDGLAYTMRTPVVREALLMMAIVGLFTYEFGVTLPLLAKFTLGSGADGLAMLMSAMGVGATLGGLVTAGRHDEGLDKLVFAAIGFSVSTALLALSPTLAMACVMMAVTGLFLARFTGISNGIVQLRSDPAMRTRAVALWSTAFVGSTFVGAPLIGWVGEVAGARWSLGVGVLGAVVAVGIGWIGLRRQRSAEAATASAAATTRPSVSPERPEQPRSGQSESAA